MYRRKSALISYSIENKLDKVLQYKFCKNIYPQFFWWHYQKVKLVVPWNFNNKVFSLSIYIIPSTVEERRVRTFWQEVSSKIKKCTVRFDSSFNYICVTLNTFSYFIVYSWLVEKKLFRWATLAHSQNFAHRQRVRPFRKRKTNILKVVMKNIN